MKKLDFPDYMILKYKELEQLKSDVSGIEIEHFIKDKKLLAWIRSFSYLFIPVQIYLDIGTDEKEQVEANPCGFEFRLNIGLLSASENGFATSATRVFSTKGTKQEVDLLYQWAKYIMFADRTLVTENDKTIIASTIKKLQNQLNIVETVQLKNELRQAEKRLKFMEDDHGFESNIQTNEIIPIDWPVRDVLKTILSQLHIYERMIWLQIAIGTWHHTICVDTHRWIIVAEDMMLFFKSTPMPLLVGVDTKLRDEPDNLSLYFNPTRKEDLVRVSPVFDDEYPPPNRNQLRGPEIEPDPLPEVEPIAPQRAGRRLYRGGSRIRGAFLGRGRRVYRSVNRQRYAVAMGFTGNRARTGQPHNL